MELTQRKIVAATVLIEGLLVLAFVIWLGLRGPATANVRIWHDAGYGLLATLPLLIFNYLVFGPLSERMPGLAGCRDFKRTVVKPLADRLDWPSALLVSAMAGIGEELFFRGVLQTELGLAVSSVLFALLHFGPAIVDHKFIGLLYTLIGAYFGWLLLFSGSLIVPIVAHSTYDFLALLYLRNVYNLSPSTG